MADIFPKYAEETEALDLLQKMLEFHPDRRITIEKALEHPFLSSLHNAEDEPNADFTFNFDFENEDLPREKVQELIWAEIRELHPYIPETYPNAQSPRRKAKQMLDTRADSKDGEEGLNGEAKASKKRSSSSPPAGADERRKNSSPIGAAHK